MRNVLVTGGSRGIGLAIVRRLSASGYHAIAIARRESDEIAAARKAGGSVAFVPYDLGNIDAMADLVKSLRTQHGPIYGLVNNAGIGTEGLLTVMRMSEIEQPSRINTLSPIALTRQVARSMMAQGEGRIVNMASVVALTGYTALSVYAATKASMVG